MTAAVLLNVLSIVVCLGFVSGNAFLGGHRAVAQSFAGGGCDICFASDLACATPEFNSYCSNNLEDPLCANGCDGGSCNPGTCYNYGDQGSSWCECD